VELFIKEYDQEKGEFATMEVNAEAFKKELTKIFKDAKEQGKEYVDVNSGDLHRRVGGYPGSNHRMPTCCGVMKSMMKSKDKILEKPPLGKGASLVIRYFLK
jgi:5-methylcytosine-specific restriction protein A